MLVSFINHNQIVITKLKNTIFPHFYNNIYSINVIFLTDGNHHVYNEQQKENVEINGGSK